MIVSSDGKNGIDYVTYFTKQFPLDLAAMAKLRDELEARQGAMTAVDDANQLRKDAEDIKAKAIADTTAARNAADQYLADAKAKNAEVNAKVSELAAKEKEFTRAKSDYESNRAVDEKSLAERIKAVAAKEAQIASREASVAAAEADLKSKQDSLDARVKAFQAKVAALSA